MIKRAHVFISGRVQGVFFRQNALKKAKSLGISGWIKNTKDGRVEAIIEGEEEKINTMIEWLKIGPPLARVKNIEIIWEKAKEEFQDFEIQYD